jgi:hypothetical protein
LPLEEVARELSRAGLPDEGFAFFLATGRCSQAPQTCSMSLKWGNLTFVATLFVVKK